ncbi:hypothetical protein M430DRAFT_34522 [Amorphotheca resinae ATCC 22711]|jgi:hypothetical protein|uniref:Uncharacterized protein n=1 Tax=Amorphotheca resinae ATCC 22711 TaxID=857342 RepID=A0A2T3B3F3_AMORE|nr:hypothetical protein M430DRAFT_34522 [Amorphotheca resinae ATCC 22711]PSS20155.1 hypothetical protein M430DRAFT_34522 [Amorphotheca resinae ATCC 22711]
MVYLKKTVRGALPSSYRKPSESRYYSNNPKSHLTYYSCASALDHLQVARAAPEGQHSTYNTGQHKGKARQDKTTSGDPPAPTSAVLARLGQESRPSGLSQRPEAVSRERERERDRHIKHQGQDQDSIQTHRLFWPRPPYHPERPRALLCYLQASMRLAPLEASNNYSGLD